MAVDGVYCWGWRVVDLVVRREEERIDKERMGL